MNFFLIIKTRKNFYVYMLLPSGIKYVTAISYISVSNYETKQHFKTDQWETLAKILLQRIWFEKQQNVPSPRVVSMILVYINVLKVIFRNFTEFLWFRIISRWFQRLLWSFFREFLCFYNNSWLYFPYYTAKGKNVQCTEFCLVVYTLLPVVNTYKRKKTLPNITYCLLAKQPQIIWAQYLVLFREY